jgi:hypothetical protein
MVNLRSSGTRPRIHNGFINVPISQESSIEIYGAIPSINRGHPMPIHDHSFGFTAKVLCGKLHEKRFKPNFHKDGKYRVAEAMFFDETAFTVEARDRMAPCDMIEVERNIIRPGETYMMEEGKYHKAMAKSPTMVFTVKRYVNHYATQNLILLKTKRNGVQHIRDHQVDAKDLWPIIMNAAKLADAEL